MNFDLAKGLYTSASPTYVHSAPPFVMSYAINIKYEGLINLLFFFLNTFFLLVHCYSHAGG